MDEESGTWRKWLAIREARAQIDALEEAVDFMEVEAFRKRHLPDGLLTDSRELKRWLGRAQIEAENVSTEMLAASEREESEVPVFESVTVEIRRPSLTGTDEPEVYELSSVQRGALAELQRVARLLSEWFGWTVESAAGWVLTGCLPTTPDMKIEQLPADGDARPNRWSAVRITVPVEVPASVLAKRYAAVREEILSALPPLPENPVGRKALSACIFAIQRNDGRTWQSVFAEWCEWIEAEGKTGAYTFRSSKNFAFTVRQTYERITGRKLEWKRGRGERET